MVSSVAWQLTLTKAPCGQLIPTEFIQKHRIYSEQFRSPFSGHVPSVASRKTATAQNNTLRTTANLSYPCHLISTMLWRWVWGEWRYGSIYSTKKNFFFCSCWEADCLLLIQKLRYRRKYLQTFLPHLGSFCSKLPRLRFIHSLVFSLRGRVGRNQSPVMWPVWLWHTASWASSCG